MGEPQRLLMLDTETTGLEASEDRLIEIGIVEYRGLTPTGSVFHKYINPGDKQLKAGAVAVHGITNEMLAKEPVFEEIADELLEYIGDDPLIIFNAGFDLGFLNAELERLNMAPIGNPIEDPMQMARKRWPRRKNTLDAVAKRVGVDVSERKVHGALKDATILGEVYCHLTSQNELVIAEVASAVVSPTIVPVERKPVLLAPGYHRTPTLSRAETSYSLFNSALSPESLVEHAKKAGYEVVALTDRNTTAAAMTFAGAAEKAGLKALVGVALPIVNSDGHPLVFYARNADGWRNIQRLVTLSNVDNGGRGLTSAQLRDHREGLAATCGGSEGAIAHMLRTQGVEQAIKATRFLSGIYPGALAMEITRHGGAPDPVIEAGLLAIAHELGLPTVGTSVARTAPGEDEMVEVLRAIGGGQDYQPDLSDQEHLRSPEEMEKLFSDMPDAWTNNGWLASLCDFAPKGAKPMLPRFATGERTEEDLLSEMALEGLERRLEGVEPQEHESYRKRYEYEMGLICGQGFAGYFLIVADFIGWARDRGIPVGPGRGSGAGSIVAWSLGITQLDPIKLNLLFERFINPDRVSLPDFDIDFCESRRDEVIRYVQERYGREHAVSIGTYGTFGARQSVKDAGRILGLPYGQMDRIAKALPDKGGMTAEDARSPEVQELVNSPELRDALNIALKISGLVRNKSKHAAGIVISEQPVADIAALEPDPKNPEILVTQYDMKPIEKAGLVKFDFLGLKTLTVIERCRVNLARMGIEIDPYGIALDDQNTYENLSLGHTMGVFQLESGGITRACREIRVDNFEDVVAIVALYRPGPMEFIPLYARRKKGLEPFGTPHPLLDDVTRDTYGILVYQEQVMQAAQVLAGYTLGQADLLRRAMGKKIQSEMDAQRATFIKGCFETNGIGEQQANDLFNIIDKFAGYGFNRSHAAAYGLLAYVTAYLKTNHPAAYMAAAMDGSINDTEQLVKLAHEARRLGIEFDPPEPRADGNHFAVVAEDRIAWSLSAIKGIGHGVVDLISREAVREPFRDFRDFVERVGEHVNKAQMGQLAAAGVLDRICGGRKEALHCALQRYEGVANEAKAKRAGQINLFGDDQPEADVAETQLQAFDDKEVLALERQALGISLSAHPLDAYVRALSSRGVLIPSTGQELLDHMPVAMAVMIDEVKIGKNKNSWMTVRVSDERASLVLGCAEDLPGSHLLQAGELLILRVSAYVTGGERRLRIDEVIGPVDKEDRAGTITVEANAALRRDALRKLLGEAAEGSNRLVVKHEDQIWMTPPMVAADPEFIAAIKKLDGVETVTL